MDHKCIKLLFHLKEYLQNSVFIFSLEYDKDIFRPLSIMYGVPVGS